MKKIILAGALAAAVTILAGCSTGLEPLTGTTPAVTPAPVIEPSLVTPDPDVEAGVIAVVQASSPALADMTADDITAAAVAACNVFDAGMPLTEWVQLAAGDGHTTPDAGAILAYAVTTICPAHADLIEGDHQ